jgi:hypothetical protein
MGLDMTISLLTTVITVVGSLWATVSTVGRGWVRLERQFATAMMACPECEAWWSALSQASLFKATTLMAFFSHPNPDPTLALGDTGSGDRDLPS